MTYEVGKGRPPKDTRFKKGVSGNPKGRPRAQGLIYDKILGREIEVRVGGVIETITVERAFLRHILKLSRQKGGALARVVNEGLNLARTTRSRQKPVFVNFCVRQDPGEVSDVLIELEMATCLSPQQPTRKLVIEHWLVEEALSRFGERRLSIEEQRIVYDATRKPHRVKWPEWWSVRSPDG